MCHSQMGACVAAFMAANDGGRGHIFGSTKAFDLTLKKGMHFADVKKYKALPDLSSPFSPKKSKYRMLPFTGAANNFFFAIF